MPRLGKIRLGKKVKGPNGTYPTEVDYFVFDDPAHVEKLGFGDKPEELKAIDVMLPSESIDECFPCALKCYKASGLHCEGDGEKALRRQLDGSWRERECPCEKLTQDKPECKQVAVLNVIVPQISVGGVFQCVTSSKTSIIDVQSGIDYVKEMIGRAKLVPLKLERVETEITYTNPKTKKQQKQKHFTLRLTFPYDIDFVNSLKDETKKILAGPRYMLPATDDLNPYADPPDLIETEGEIRNAEATIVDAEAPAKTPPKKPAKKDPPPAAPAAPEYVPMDRVKAFWLNVQRIFGPNDEAKSFMEFFVKAYCAAPSSKEITLDVFDPQEAVIHSILKTIAKEGQSDAGAAWWDDLQHQVRDDTTRGA
jgi:hypothetical protein